MKKWIVPSLIFLMMSMACKREKQPADLVVYNAVVYTVDEGFAVQEAFAVKDGKFLAIGSTENILNMFSGKKEMDCKGMPVYPGFIDAHCHFLSYGTGLAMNADLSGTTSPDEVIERLKAHSLKHKGEWLTGRGWDQNDWAIKQFPDKHLLDRHFSGIPVFLTRIDGHAAWVNSKAMEMAGITASTAVEGGQVMLAGGEPSGILLDNAMEIIRNIVPKPDRSMKIRALREASENCLAVGLTTVFDAGLGYEDVTWIDSLYKSGETGLRINAMLVPSEENLEHYVNRGPYYADRLVVNSIKLYSDGALGSRGALLLEPYSDDPDNSGIAVITTDSIREICEIAIEKDFSVNTHAIGDSANRFVLNVYGEFLKGKNDRRWRIEHAQVIHPEDFALFGKFSVIPSVQPTHATSDMYWAKDRLGAERLKGAYAYRQLLDQNGWLPLGTDFPVEKINPLLTFYAAVARQDTDGFPSGGFQMENALSREQALKGMTIWAARSGFMENITGSIETGKHADFVILDRDIMKVPSENLPASQVLAVCLLGQLTEFFHE